MRVRTEHWELLLELFENYPELVTGKFNGVEGKAKGASLWRNVASKLNSLGFGEKSVDGWRKAVTDWKSKTKSKAAAFKKEAEKAGGGPNLLPPLSTLEERLISIMGKKCIIGDNVPELGFKEAFVAGDELEKTMNKFVPQELEIETSVYTMDHDYLKLANKPISSSTNPSQLEKKRKLEISTLEPQTSVTPNKQVKTRRKPSQQVHLTSDLLKLNKDTTKSLGNIDKNTERIANNLESIAHDIKIIATFLKNR